MFHEAHVLCVYICARIKCLVIKFLSQGKRKPDYAADEEEVIPTLLFGRTGKSLTSTVFTSSGSATKSIGCVPSKTLKIRAMGNS